MVRVKTYRGTDDDGDGSEEDEEERGEKMERLIDIIMSYRQG